MPLDHRRTGLVHDRPLSLTAQVPEKFRCRGSNPGLVGESHLFCHYTTSEYPQHEILRDNAKKIKEKKCSRGGSNPRSLAHKTNALTD